MPKPQPTPKQTPDPKGTAKQGTAHKEPRVIFTDWASI